MDLPEAFRLRACTLLAPDVLQRWRDTFALPPPMAVRWCGAGPMPSDLFDVLVQGDLSPRHMDWFAEGIHLESGTRTQVRALELMQQGHLVLQAASSMVAACALAPAGTHDVLDLCAAPGGKTALLHRLMSSSPVGGAGRLVANDSSRKRLGRMREQLAHLGIQDVHITCAQGAALANDLECCFDRVLVDAPCSGEGRWHGGDSSAWTNWSLSSVRTLAKRQTSLLQAACRMARPGGRIVYATCTLSPEENEAVVARVVKRAPFELDIVPLDVDPPGGVPGLLSWQDNQWPQVMSNCRRLLPATAGMTGFFVATLHRIT
jgi:16S rRNA (cytosine1407-C5)-methyltransferase